jgi:hypothetical protein
MHALDKIWGTSSHEDISPLPASDIYAQIFGALRKTASEMQNPATTLTSVAGRFTEFDPVALAGHSTASAGCFNSMGQ